LAERVDLAAETGRSSVATRRPNGRHINEPMISQPMDLNASLQFMQLNFLVGYYVANEPQRPRWKPGDFFGEVWAQMICHHPRCYLMAILVLVEFAHGAA
jgi:hypothetical protein